MVDSRIRRHRPAPRAADVRIDRCAQPRHRLTPGAREERASAAESHVRGVATVDLPEPPVGASTDVLEAPSEPIPELDVPLPSAGRLVRLRSRLARSQSTLGRGLLSVLSRDTIGDEDWDEIEDTLLTADMGVTPTMELVEALKTRVRVLGARSPEPGAHALARRAARPGGHDHRPQRRHQCTTGARRSCSSSV